jgi:hypothetical protein
LRRVANGGIDDLGMEGRILIGDVSVKSDAGIIPILGVYLASGFAAATCTIALTIRRRSIAFAPVRRERGAMLMVDYFG